MSTLATAMAIACDEFENISDKAGRPYAEHCMIVAEGVRHLGDTYMIVGWLHDLLEDTQWTTSMLRDHGFSEEVIEALVILTHKGGVDYLGEYIKAIALNDIARAVKLSDLSHNMACHRLKGLGKKDFDRLEKYTRAYTYLKN